MTAIRKIDGHPIFWRDEGDIVHGCEGAYLVPEILVFWTFCNRDVPANAAYASPEEQVTCPKCWSEFTQTPRPPKRRLTVIQGGRPEEG